jgi:hypothetical protein
MLALFVAAALGVWTLAYASFAIFVALGLRAWPQ